MTTLPMLSASAFVPVCHNTTPNSSANSPHSMVVAQIADISNEHDCCENLEIPCDHSTGSCDCENGQTSSSIINKIESTFFTPKFTTHKDIVPSLFTSKIADSLYRPPIIIL